MLHSNYIECYLFFSKLILLLCNISGRRMVERRKQTSDIGSPQIFDLYKGIRCWKSEERGSRLLEQRTKRARGKIKENILFINTVIWYGFKNNLTANFLKYNFYKDYFFYQKGFMYLSKWEWNVFNYLNLPKLFIV